MIIVGRTHEHDTRYCTVLDTRNEILYIGVSDTLCMQRNACVGCGMEERRMIRAANRASDNIYL